MAARQTRLVNTVMLVLVWRSGSSPDTGTPLLSRLELLNACW